MKFIILASLLAVAFADDKIVGGHPTTKGELKSIVTLRRNGGQFCSATLISDKWLVSAAHCHYNAQLITIHAGDYSLLTIDEGEQSQQPKECIKHEQYSSRTLQNDIMMIELSSPIVETEFVVPAKMRSTQLPDGYKCQVCGWGNTELPGNAAWPNEPLCVDIAVISTSVCNGRLAYNGEILDGMVCIGEMDGGVDSCQGDSGGPVYCNDSGIFTEDDNGEFSAVVSWGYGCADKNNPGVYSDVYFYREYIRSHAGI